MKNDYPKTTLPPKLTPIARSRKDKEIAALDYYSSASLDLTNHSTLSPEKKYQRTIQLLRNLLYALTSKAIQTIESPSQDQKREDAVDYLETLTGKTNQLVNFMDTAVQSVISKIHQMKLKAASRDREISSLQQQLMMNKKRHEAIEELFAFHNGIVCHSAYKKVRIAN